MNGKRQSTIEVKIGKRIRTLRIIRKMTQETLAGKLHIRVQQVQKYEKGVNRIAASRLLTVAKHLKMPVAAFYGQDNNGKPFVIDLRVNNVVRNEIMAILDKRNSRLADKNALAIVRMVVNRKWKTTVSPSGATMTMKPDFR